MDFITSAFEPPSPSQNFEKASKYDYRKERKNKQLHYHVNNGIDRLRLKS